MTNQTTKLRWGILGAARVNERLLPAIMEAGNSELVAIASRRVGAALEILKKYAPKNLDISNINAYDSLEELLADKNVQAIYIPLANHEHAEWALKVIASGRHVLIEKPLAIKLADIEAIEAAAIKANVKVMEGFMYRFHPQHARISEIVASGVIGDILSVRSSFSFLMREARMYRINRSMADGGGALWDIGPYAIHMLRWGMGMVTGKPLEPINVIATAKLNDHGADIVTSGILDFGRDAKDRARFGQFDISFERSRKSEYELIGDKGWLKCHTAWAFDKDIPVISWGNDAGESGEEELKPANHFTLEIEHFSDCVLNNKTPLLSFDDARANCIALEMCVLQASIDEASGGIK